MTGSQWLNIGLTVSSKLLKDLHCNDFLISWYVTVTQVEHTSARFLHHCTILDYTILFILLHYLQLWEWTKTYRIVTSYRAFITKMTIRFMFCLTPSGFVEYTLHIFKVGMNWGIIHDYASFPWRNNPSRVNSSTIWKWAILSYRNVTL